MSWYAFHSVWNPFVHPVFEGACMGGYQRTDRDDGEAEAMCTLNMALECSWEGKKKDDVSVTSARTSHALAKGTNHRG